MAVKSAYYGSMGPFEYESTTLYADGKRFKGFRGRAKLEGDADDAPLNIDTSVAPTSPDDGDVWILTTGMYARVNGVTILVTGASGSVAIGNTLSGDVTATFEADGDTPVTINNTALNALKALTPAADRLPYFDGASSAALATFTAFGRSLVDDADASAGRTTLGLGTIATQAASNVAITGGTINGTTIGASTPSSGAFTTGSFTGDVTISGNAGGARSFNIYRGPTTSTDIAVFDFETNGSLRWRWRFDGQETGSNAGSRLVLQTFSDSGVYIDDFMSLTRASGGGFSTARPFTASAGINIPTGQTYKVNSTQIGLSNGLAGVLVSTPAAGHMLLYDDTDSRFENVAMSGDATITKAGVLSLAAGLSNKSIYTNSTRVGNLGGGEDDLMTYTVPAGTLANTNERLVVHGVFNVDTAGANTLKAYWNGVAVYDSGSVTPTASYISIRVTIIRTSATSQDIIVEVITASTTHTARVIHTTGTATLSGAVVVKFTGQDAGSTNDDIAQEWMSVDYIKTN